MSDEVPKKPTPNEAPTVDDAHHEAASAAHGITSILQGASLHPLVWSVPELIKRGSETADWIISNLIKPGDQILISGAPKSGKSLIASEIALGLALPFRRGEARYLFGAERNDNFPGLAITPPQDPKRFSKAGESWRVLVFALEMKESEVGDRLRKQLRHFAITPPDSEEKTGEPLPANLQLHHIFGIGEARDGELRKDLEIIKEAANKTGQSKVDAKCDDADTIQSIVAAVRPDVVIFDTLIQLHQTDENDNILMKAVMRRIRSMVEFDDFQGGKRVKPAQIVLHHQRKEGQGGRGALTADSMRGAGAVHAAADVVVSIRPAYDDTELLDVNVSSRSSSIPNFRIKREKDLCHRYLPPKPEDSEKKSDKKNRIMRQAILEAMADGDSLLWADLEERAMSKAKKDLGAPFPSTFFKSRLNSLIKEKKIAIEDRPDAKGLPKELADCRIFRFRKQGLSN
ncbi:MAG: AAA family ATPase [Opitutaceae bacterium]